MAELLYANLEPQEAGIKFQDDVLAEMRKLNELCYVTPLADTRSASRSEDVRFINPQPSDISGVSNGGKSLYIECKASESHADMYDRIQLIRKNQAVAALRVTRMQGNYFFVFLDRINSKIKAYDGEHAARFYQRKVRDRKPPLLSMPWARRREFFIKLLEEHT